MTIPKLASVRSSLHPSPPFMLLAIDRSGDFLQGISHLLLSFAVHCNKSRFFYGEIKSVVAKKFAQIKSVKKVLQIFTFFIF